MRTFKYLFSGIAVLAILSTVQVPVYAAGFYDDFNTENGGASQLNYNPFANWTINNGTVDVIKNGDYSINCASGVCVDLDGSTSAAGIMRSIQTFAPGTYTLQFELSGNQRGGDADTVDIALGTLLKSITVNSSDPFKTYSYTAIISSPSQLIFHNIGGDNIGAILDNVKVSSVPIPAAAWLLGSGLLGLLGFRRKFSK